MDVIERIERGLADAEDAAAVSNLVAALIAALHELSAHGMHAGAQSAIVCGLEALHKVLNGRA